MKKFLSKKLKSEKGFTLVELLAVIVILGILAAIAIPMIMNLIGDSRKDAHNATAQQMIEAARLAAVQTYTENPESEGNTAEFTLQELINGEYLSVPESPDGGTYNLSKSKVTITSGQYKAELFKDQTLVGEAGSDSEPTQSGSGN